MRAYLVAGILLATTACSGSEKANSAASDADPSADAPADASSPVSKTATAILTCTINGMQAGAYACLIGSHEEESGSLKVKSGGEVKQYTPYELMSHNDYEFKIPLKEPFDVEAQANSEEGYVLRLEIIRDGKKIFQDEATTFAPISYDSELN